MAKKVVGSARSVRPAHYRRETLIEAMRIVWRDAFRCARDADCSETRWGNADAAEFEKMLRFRDDQMVLMRAYAGRRIRAASNGMVSTVQYAAGKQHGMVDLTCTAADGEQWHYAFFREEGLSPVIGAFV